jgi:hypothetical protein
MSNSHLGWLASVALISLDLATTRVAHADPKSCITSHATGQREAKAGHLRLATQLFTKCGSDESCPAQLRQECAEFLQSVQRTVPTVIFSVVDEKNRDISTAKVYSTDELVADGLDGRALEIDPGKHRLRFLLPGGEVLNSDVLIREGEKNRLIQVKVTPEDSAAIEGPAKEPVQATRPEAVAPPPPITEAKSASPAVRPGPPLGAWVAAGAAVVGLGVGTTFALLGNSKKSDIDACSPHCGNETRPSYDALKRDYLIADIGFAVGAVSAGVATWLFVKPRSASSGDTSDSAKSSAFLRVRPSAYAVPGGGALAVSGSF